MSPEKQKVQRVVLGAAIFHKERLLILKRSASERIFPEKWELPGGKREFAETCEQGIHREVLEESGLRIRLLDVCSTFDYVLETAERIVDSTQINFLAVPATDDPVICLSKEHQAFGWIDETDLHSYEMSDAMHAVIVGTFKKYRDYQTIGLWEKYLLQT